jgi:hypothetical protein
MALFGSNVTAAAAAVPQHAAPRPFGLAGDDVLAASQALSLDYEVTVPGMARPFRPYQAPAYVAAQDAIARWGCAILGDDMGLGKTQVMLAMIAERVVRQGYAIVVGPPVGLGGWMNDTAAAFPGLRLAHLFGRKADFAGMPIADVYFLNDDSQTMEKWLTTVTIEHQRGHDVKVHRANAFARGASILLRDEIHRDKGNQGKPSGRAKVMLALGEDLRAQGTPIIVATGTLLTNRPVEAFLPLQIAGGEALVKAVTPGARKASGFLFRYCQPTTNGYGTSFAGADMDEMERLHEYLRRTVYIRREKSDLGDVLPHGGWIIKPLALPNAAMRTYDRVVKNFLAWYEETRGKGASERAARAETIVRMGQLWDQAGVAKCDAAVDYAMDLVDQGRKVVLFYYHQDVWTALATGLSKAGCDYTTVSGAVTGDARRHAVNEFQAEDGPMVMLAQIKAAGMAVTLTRAADAVFVQVPWSAGDLKQAADRILRSDDITMERAANGERITWHVLQAAYEDGETTFDMAMWGILESKARVCDMVNAGRPVTMSEDNIHEAVLEAWLPTARSRWR